MQTVAFPLPIPKRPKRRWYLVGGFALFVIATPFLYSLIVGVWRDYQLEQIYRGMDAEDPNWRWADMVKQLPPVPPDERNAMVQMQKVVRLNKAMPFVVPFGTRIPLPRNARLTIADEQRLRAALAALPPKVLEEARKLKDMPEGGIAIDPEVAAMDLKFEPELICILRIARVLEHDAMLEAQGGKLEEAAAICLAIAHSAHAGCDSPNLMAQLVRTTIAGNAASAIERMLGQGVLDEESLEPLQKALMTEAKHDGIVQALRGERAGSHEYYLALRHGKISNEKFISDWGLDRTPQDKRYYLFPSLLHRGYAERLRILNEAVRASTLKDEARIEAYCKIEETKKDFAAPWGDVIFIVGQIKGLHADQTRTRCAVAAIAAERYRLKYDRWPNGVAELMKEGLLKEPITDPYDGQPLRFHRTETGMTVYSVGADKIDNQGKKGNIAFELWLPNFRATAPAAEAPRK
jgi:hypothetical protein